MTEADETLGRRLAALADHIEPTNVDLVPAVTAAIETAPVRSGRPVVAAAAAVVVIALILTAVSPARTAVAGWLGIGNTRVDVVDELPEATPTTSSKPASSSSILPPDLALPDEQLTGPVLGRETRDLPGATESVVRYAAVTLSASSVESEITAVKSVKDPEAVSSAIITDGAPALWIEGAHTRTVGAVTTIVEASTLIWVRDGYEYRLTGAISRDLAVTIAESIG